MSDKASQHPGLFKKALFVPNDDLHWVRTDLALDNSETMAAMARIRYRQTLQSAKLHKVTDGLYVVFDEAQSAITEGQFVAFYQDKELIGSGVIS